MSLIMCTPENPGMDGEYFHTPYVEAVSGYRHGFRDIRGITWTRDPNHQPDPRCPECAAVTKGTS